ncbi:MAG: NCS2 family permease [Clostridiales bacterium]|nr:NCS2 family permease [Clostridiales bacterium]
MDKFFGLKEKGTTVRTEILAGITTFFAMAYIIFVNPSILSDPFNITGQADVAAGIRDSVFIATCIASFIGTILMGLYAKLPFAQAPGMGLNAYFAYTMVLTLGYTFGQSLAAVFISGILFIIITLVGLREAIVRAIPNNIKIAISAGIGLFITLIGLKNAGVVVGDDATLLALSNFSQWTDVSAAALLSLIGLMIIGVLYKLKVKGAIFLSIIASTVIGIPLGVTKLGGWSAAPLDFSSFFQYGWFKMDFAGLLKLNDGSLWTTVLSLLTVVIALSMVDMFDTIGTLLGTARKADMLRPDGTLPNMRKALLCDAVATTVGACVGTSTVTTYIESGTGVSEGGKTGLTSTVTAVLFLVALFFAPAVGIIPSAATAPALIFVGVLMLSAVKEIDFSDITEAIPAFLTVVMMPFSYSIATGIAFGLISHLVLKALTGKIKETSVITWVIALLFIIRFITVG